jgi:hypothetical protein
MSSVKTNDKQDFIINAPNQRTILTLNKNHSSMGMANATYAGVAKHKTNQ